MSNNRNSRQFNNNPIGKPRHNVKQFETAENQKPLPELTDEVVHQLKELPITFQALADFFGKFGSYNPFTLRKETISRIESLTGRPLITYVSRVYNISEKAPVGIDDSDMDGFADAIYSLPSGGPLDVFIISNGGNPTASERIVQMLRDKFSEVRFIVPSNAYSAATLICFAGDEIIMDPMATLGPIDPQINGTPIRTILRAFEVLEKKVATEGPMVLATYAKLIEKYSLHDLEFCKTAEALSKELAQTWLSKYMFKCNMDDPKIKEILEYFTSFDLHKSHGRSIDRKKAKELKLSVTYSEDIENLAPLVRSLYNQYQFWFNVTPFYKMFENSKGINWGRQMQTIQVQVPMSTPQN